MREGMPCPVCTVDLVMSERQGIEIDYCPKCRGVWLDRGELDKLLERASLYSGTAPQELPSRAQSPAPSPWVTPGASAPAHGPATPPTWDQGSGYEYHGSHGDHDRYRRRKKSWLEDLFD